MRRRRTVDVAICGCCLGVICEWDSWVVVACGDHEVWALVHVGCEDEWDCRFGPSLPFDVVGPEEREVFRRWKAS
jgi:hypothetical protein